MEVGNRLFGTRKEDSWELFIQLNTYGSNDREMKGNSSQAMTFDRESGMLLRDMLLTIYPLNLPETPKKPPNSAPNY